MSEVIKVLIVDDESTVQSIISTFVKRYFDSKGMNCEIKTVTDPVQGLFLLNSYGNTFRIVLLDVRLPKLTGDEIYNSLLHGDGEILDRVMFITGYPNDILDRFPDLNLNILQKPFRYDDLKDKLEGLMSSN